MRTNNDNENNHVGIKQQECGQRQTQIVHTESDRNEINDDHNNPHRGHGEFGRVLAFPEAILTAEYHDVPIDEQNGDENQIAGQQSENELVPKTQRLVRDVTRYPEYVHGNRGQYQQEQVADAPIDHVQVDVRFQDVVFQYGRNDEYVGDHRKQGDKQRGHFHDVRLIFVDVVRIERGVLGQIGQIEIHFFVCNVVTISLRGNLMN